MRSTCFSIAWFPGIVPVGFLLAEVRPPTLGAGVPALYIGALAHTNSKNQSVSKQCLHICDKSSSHLL